ncbi:hypothetical protein F5146DRAFT_1147329 [Armillaria mellea]|nr:hypothetical protein F5146DRAFT_1147329 [Armillaria mellea]
MCPDCPATFYSLTDSASFDPKNFEPHDPWCYLKRGVKYAIINELANWLPGISSLVDWMHAIFLCLVKHTVKNILYNTGMFTNDGLAKMDQFFAMLIWLPSVSHLPPKISRGAGSVKADQWKMMITVFFVAVFMAWEVDGEIPDTNALLPAANTKIFKAKTNQEKLFL